MITFANGEAIWWYGEGVNTFVGPTELEMHTHITFTGGTGSYEGCTGWLDVEGFGVIDFDTFDVVWSYAGEGEVTY